MSIENAKGLTDFLLNYVRQRPAMYLGEANISNLSTFIIGYNIGFNTARKETDDLDEYFSENGFLEWFEKKYKIERPGSWRTPFLDQSNNDEKKALMLFFKYLEEYQNEK